MCAERTFLKMDNLSMEISNQGKVENMFGYIYSIFSGLQSFKTARWTFSITKKVTFGAWLISNSNLNCPRIYHGKKCNFKFIFFNFLRTKQLQKTKGEFSTEKLWNSSNWVINLFWKWSWIDSINLFFIYNLNFTFP